MLVCPKIEYHSVSPMDCHFPYENGSLGVSPIFRHLGYLGWWSPVNPASKEDRKDETSDSVSSTWTHRGQTTPIGQRSCAVSDGIEQPTALKKPKDSPTMKSICFKRLLTALSPDSHQRQRPTKKRLTLGNQYSQCWFTIHFQWMYLFSQVYKYKDTHTNNQ
jgi:hypothetical protein